MHRSPPPVSIDSRAPQPLADITQGTQPSCVHYPLRGAAEPWRSGRLTSRSSGGVTDRARVRRYVAAVADWPSGGTGTEARRLAGQTAVVRLDHAGGPVG